MKMAAIPFVLWEADSEEKQRVGGKAGQDGVDLQGVLDALKTDSRRRESKGHQEVERRCKQSRGESVESINRMPESLLDKDPLHPYVKKNFC